MNWRLIVIALALALFAWWGLSHWLSALWSGVAAVVVALFVPQVPRLCTATKQTVVPRDRRAARAELEALVRRADAPLPQRTDALRRLIRRYGVQMIPLVDEVFDTDDELRPEAVRSYGRLKLVNAIPKIASIIEGSAPPLGKAAAIALGVFKTPEAEAALCRCIDHEARIVVWEAAESLRRIGRETARDRLEALLEATVDDDELRRHVMRALKAVRRRTIGPGALSVVSGVVGGLSLARGRPAPAEGRETIKWFGDSEAVFNLEHGLYLCVMLGLIVVIWFGVLSPASRAWVLTGSGLLRVWSGLLFALWLYYLLYLRPRLDDLDFEDRCERIRLRILQIATIVSLVVLSAGVWLSLEGVDLEQYFRLMH
jgi:hypothetical protein